MKLIYFLLAAHIINPLIACENSEYNPDGDYFFMKNAYTKIEVNSQKN